VDLGEKEERKERIGKRKGVGRGREERRWGWRKRRTERNLGKEK